MTASDSAEAQGIVGRKRHILHDVVVEEFRLHVLLHLQAYPPLAPVYGFYRSPYGPHAYKRPGKYQLTRPEPVRALRIGIRRHARAHAVAGLPLRHRIPGPDRQHPAHNHPKQNHQNLHIKPNYRRTSTEQTSVFIFFRIVKLHFALQDHLLKYSRQKAVLLYNLQTIL